MPASLDRRAYAELTTSAVPAGEAFAYWREMICATFVRLAAEPVGPGPAGTGPADTGPPPTSRWGTWRCRRCSPGASTSGVRPR
jgi:hypothetical protein